MSDPHIRPARERTEILRARADALGEALAGQPDGAEELITDGYAHLLAIDVERTALQREVSRLAESGDPAMAGRLRELAMLSRSLQRAAETLREALEAARERAHRDR